MTLKIHSAHPAGSDRQKDMPWENLVGGGKTMLHARTSMVPHVWHDRIELPQDSRARLAGRARQESNLSMSRLSRMSRDSRATVCGACGLFQYPARGVAGLPFTARIERAPFHRVRSASKKGAWPRPSILYPKKPWRSWDGAPLALVQAQRVSGASGRGHRACWPMS
jgi:hypothetical protein